MVLALLLGVVAMHAMVAPMTDDRAASISPADHTGPAFVSVAPLPMISQGAMVGGSSAGVARPESATLSSGGPSDPAAPMPMAHDIMHLCLAVLAAVVALGVAMIVLIVGARERSSAAPRRTRSVTFAARPPPRTAVRLAQLCVLRN